MIKNLAGTSVHLCVHTNINYMYIFKCVHVYIYTHIDRYIICTHMSFEYLLFVIGCKIAASFKAEKLPVLLGSGNSPHPLRITPPTTTIKQKNTRNIPSWGTNISFSQGMFEDDVPFPVWWDR